MMIIRNVCSFPEGIFLILSTKVIVSSLYIVHKLNTYQGGHVSLSLCLKSDILKFPVIRHLLFRFFKRCYIATASVTTLCATCLPVALTSVVKTVESWNHARNLANTLEGGRNRPCPYSSSSKTRVFLIFSNFILHKLLFKQYFYFFLFAPLEIISHKNCC